MTEHRAVGGGSLGCGYGCRRGGAGDVGADGDKALALLACCPILSCKTSCQCRLHGPRS